MKNVLLLLIVLLSLLLSSCASGLKYVNNEKAKSTNSELIIKYFKDNSKTSRKNPDLEFLENKKYAIVSGAERDVSQGMVYSPYYSSEKLFLVLEAHNNNKVKSYNLVLYGNQIREGLTIDEEIRYSETKEGNTFYERAGVDQFQYPLIAWSLNREMFAYVNSNDGKKFSVNAVFMKYNSEKKELEFIKFAIRKFEEDEQPYDLAFNQSGDVLSWGVVTKGDDFYYEAIDFRSKDLVYKRIDEVQIRGFRVDPEGNNAICYIKKDSNYKLFWCKDIWKDQEMEEIMKSEVNELKNPNIRISFSRDYKKNQLIGFNMIKTTDTEKGKIGIYNSSDKEIYIAETENVGFISVSLKNPEPFMPPLWLYNDQIVLFHDYRQIYYSELGKNPVEMAYRKLEHSYTNLNSLNYYYTDKYYIVLADDDGTKKIKEIALDLNITDIEESIEPKVYVFKLYKSEGVLMMCFEGSVTNKEEEGVFNINTLTISTSIQKTSLGGKEFLYFKVDRIPEESEFFKWSDINVIGEDTIPPN